MEADTLRDQIQCRFDDIKTEIEAACLKSGRDVEEVQVLAISKKQAVEVLRAAHEVGINTFGESYVQEALEKMEHLAELRDLHWEMVGHVQSRKARQVAENFDRLHSLDSLKLAELLNRHRPISLKPLQVYLEVNLAGEESKSGFQAVDDADWKALIPIVKRVNGMNGLQLVGLMAMPPLFEDPELSRPYFVKLRKLKDYLNTHIQNLSLEKLSAGTSSDFTIAIEEGATVIRIGERLLGPRNYQN